MLHTLPPAAQAAIRELLDKEHAQETATRAWAASQNQPAGIHADAFAPSVTGACVAALQIASDDLQKGRDETRKLVENLPAAGLDADKPAKLDKAQEALMMLPSDQRAAQLRDMSTWFNTDDKLGYQSSLQKAGAFAEQERPAEARRAELQNVVRQDAAEMERVAAAAQAELARNPAPATQAAHHASQIG